MIRDFYIEIKKKSFTCRTVINEIKDELNLTNLDISKKLFTEQDRIIWESMSLTSDIQSMENAAIVVKVNIIFREMKALKE